MSDRGNEIRSHREHAWWLRPWAWLDGVRQDLVYALRMMRKSWGFTAIAVASLALGIGGNTALFSLVDRLMLRTLPVREPERLVQVTSHQYDVPQSWTFSYRIYQRIREMDLFEGIAGWRYFNQPVEWNGENRNRPVTLVTGDSTKLPG